MLQHNAQQAGRRAHLAHAAVVSLHTVCCGLPVLAMAAAGLAGATSGVALLSEKFEYFHAFLHAHEIWVLWLSAALVVTGAALEAAGRLARQSTGFPWLFAFSVFCFLANAAVILAHRG